MYNINNSYNNLKNLQLTEQPFIIPFSHPDGCFLMAPTKFRFFTKQIANKHAYTKHMNAKKNESTYIHEKQLIYFEDEMREKIL